MSEVRLEKATSRAERDENWNQVRVEIQQQCEMFNLEPLEALISSVICCMGPFLKRTPELDGYARSIIDVLHPLFKVEYKPWSRSALTEEELKELGLNEKETQNQSNVE